MRRDFAVLVGLFITMWAGAPLAHATVPGTNGKIAFAADRDGSNPGKREIYVVSPDGSGETNLTNSPDDDSFPAWSPDGTRIAFVSDRENHPFDQYPDIWTMNADGSGLGRVTTHAGAENPEWSPDGSKLVFRACPANWTGCGLFSVDSGGGDIQPAGSPWPDCRYVADPAWSPYGEPVAIVCEEQYGSGRIIWTMNPGGTGASPLASGAGDAQMLDWSPDYRQVVFDTSSAVKTVSWPDGKVRDVPGTSSDLSPTWSPDGSQLAVSSWIGSAFARRIVTIHADGSRANVTQGPGFDTDPDWQPVDPATVAPGYVRPKSASPLSAFLVPAYRRCQPGNANRVHGPPLAYPSCAPPGAASNLSNLTVGTADSNGAPTLFLGQVDLRTIRGNPGTPADEADLEVSTSMTDIRCRYTIVEDPDTEGFPCRSGAMTDYTGEVRVQIGARLTDKPVSGERTGTGTDATFRFTVPCSATPSEVGGSNCSVVTTVESVLPGAIAEGTRSVWNVDRVEVWDGGLDGDADTGTDNEPFLTQGVFVP